MEAVNLLQASVTAFFTIVVFVLGQLIDKLFIQSIQKQKEAINEIVYALTYYANIIPWTDPIDNRKIINKEELKYVSQNIRDLAAQLRASEVTIPLYKLLTKMHLVLSKETIKNLSAKIIGWSNTLYEVEGRNRQKFYNEIKDILKLDFD